MSNVITRNPPESGELLLAQPFLPDSNFSRTVILLTECNEEGAVGFVLNRPLEVRLKDVVVDDLGGFDAPLYYGGPVEPDTLHYLHTLGTVIEGSVMVAPGVFWGGSFEVVRSLMLKGEVRPSDFRFFIGYSGWGTGQLESEMEERSWIKTNMGPRQAFSSEPESLWKQILSALGGKYRMMANYPISPSLN